MIETELRNLIVPSSSSIPAIGTRLYVGNMPTTVIYPAVAMYPISEVEMPEASVMTERIQFSCYADSLSSATDIANAVKTKLKSFQGLPSTGSAYTIMSAYPENQTYLYDSELLKHVKILDMIIMYRS